MTRRQPAHRTGEPVIHPSASVREAKLGRFTELRERVSFHDSTLGDYSYLERGAAAIYTDIGKFCAIAANAQLNALEHPIDRVTQHKISYRPNEYFAHRKLDGSFRAHRRAQRVTLGHDVWVGHGAVVLPGVAIGTGAVVGAGAVVTKDVPPYWIVAGVPARRLRRRFPAEVAARLIALAWWDWPHEKLEAAIEDMARLEVTAFLDAYEALGRESGGP